VASDGAPIGKAARSSIELLRELERLPRDVRRRTKKYNLFTGARDSRVDPLRHPSKTSQQQQKQCSALLFFVPNRISSS
jgi:hypothetical protein